MKRLLALFGLLTLPLLGLAQSSILGVGMYGSSYISMASGAGGGASTYAPSSYILDGYNATGVTPSTATYVSGLTATGAKGATCTLTLTGGTTQAVGTVVLTGTNVVATGAAITFSTVGTGYVVAPTAAAVTNGTATCSGTAIVSSSLGAYTAFATDALGNLQTSMGNYASAPATCSTGQTYFNTGNSTPYYCSATNTWTAFGGGGIPTINSSALPVAFTGAGQSATIAGGVQTINIPGGSSSSTTVLYVSQLGCAAQNVNPVSGLTFAGGTAIDDTACINAALSSATSAHPLQLIQDGYSLVSGIVGPADGNWQITGTGQGVSEVSCSAWSITGNVLTLTCPNDFAVGEVFTLENFGTSTFFNNQVITVLSAGLSTAQFEANFTHANGSATEFGEAVAFHGSGFYMKSGSNKHVIANGPTGALDPNVVAPNRGANVIISNLIMNGNRGTLVGGLCTGDSSGADCRGNTGADTWYTGIDLINLDDIWIDNVRIFNPPTYGFLCDNCGYVRVTNSNFDPFYEAQTVTSTNQDGIHFDGPSNDIYIANNYFRTGDDAIAFNANEGYCGPISRVEIVNNTSLQSQSMLRLDPGSNTSTCASGAIANISTVNVANYSGSANIYALMIGAPSTPLIAEAATDIKWTNSTITSPFMMFYQNAVGTVEFDNVDWYTPNCVSPGYTDIGCGFVQPVNYATLFDALTINDSNIVRTSTQNAALGILDTVDGGPGGGSGPFTPASTTITKMTVHNFGVLDMSGAPGTPIAYALRMGSSSTVTNYVYSGLDQQSFTSPLNSAGTVTNTFSGWQGAIYSSANNTFGAAPLGTGNFNQLRSTGFAGDIYSFSGVPYGAEGVSLSGGPIVNWRSKYVIYSGWQTGIDLALSANNGTPKIFGLRVNNADNTICLVCNVFGTGAGTGVNIDASANISNIQNLGAVTGTFVGSSSGELGVTTQNTGNAAGSDAYLRACGGTGTLCTGFYAFDSNRTPVGMIHPLSTYISSASGLTGGLFINTETSAPITLGTNGTSALVIDASQNTVVHGGTNVVYICSGGTFNGLLATSSGACTGGTGAATHLTID